jgi:hypothetical protein
MNPLKDKTDIELMAMLIKMEKAFQQIGQNIDAVKAEIQSRVVEFESKSNEPIQ